MIRRRIARVRLPAAVANAFLYGARHMTNPAGRRRLVSRAIVATLLATPLASFAQPSTARVHRIGFLGNSTAALEANLVGPFRDGLRELGYVEGRNLIIEYRWADGDYKRFPKLIAELAALRVEIIVTAGTPSAQAVQRVAPSMPLVMVAVGDPVGTGLVASLAHPGGKSTGLTSIAPDLEGKRLELLTQVVPGLSHVAVIWNPDNAFHVGSEREVQVASHVLHFDVLSLRVRSAADFDQAFAALAAARPGGLLVLADRVYLHNRARIVEFAARQRLPAVYAYRELVDAGGLMSFGPDYAEMHRRAAVYVDRILKGANPGELPIEQPTKFRLLINLRTARALGLAIPQSLLLRADEVIQ
jgi:putative tryptophan/tyrosine transport system substrate-binding protein